MHCSQKGFIGGLLLIVIAALFIGGGVYTYMQKHQLNQFVTASSTPLVIPAGK